MAHEIRPATRDDIPMLAEVALLAARSHGEVGVFDLMIETSEQDRLRAARWMLGTEQSSWCHYSNFLVATVDGVPGAALSGYAAYDAAHIPLGKSIAGAMQAVGMDEAAMNEAFVRVALFDRVIKDDEPGAWVIEWVACLPAFRRRGLVRELMDAILARGAERGHALSHLGLLIGNLSAQRVYEQVGFEIAYQLTDPEFEAAVGCPGLARMIRKTPA